MKNLLEEEIKPAHFVCTGDCGSTSKKPMVCGNQGCTHEGEPYEECVCEDGNHSEARKDVKPAQEINL